MSGKKTQLKFFKSIECMLFLGLCSLSIYFMWGVLDKYISGDRSFAKFEGKINEFPTITLCLNKPEDSDKMIYEYGTDFEIEYRLFKEGSYVLFESIFLIEGKNSSIKERTLFLEKIITMFNGYCYKISVIGSFIYY